MIEVVIMKLFALYISFIFVTNGLLAQDKVQAEKIKWEVSNKLLHPLIQNKEKEKTEIELVIPTSQPSAKCWKYRAWETSHSIKEALDLLEIGISYQINCFIISGESLQSADKSQKVKLFNIAKEFNIQIIIKSATFSLPIKKSDLEDLEDFANTKGADVLISIDSSLKFSNEKTIEFLNAILSFVKNKEKKIYCEAFSRDESFLQALQQINDSRIIPIFNWTKGHWSLLADLNPLISKYEKNSVVRMDASLENFGKNKTLALLQDYIGYRQTQCAEVSKNIQGFTMDFGKDLTSFGTLNAVNIFTMVEFLLNRDKDLDIINNNWFTAQYEHKDGLEILNITSTVANILRQSLYANNSSEIQTTKELIPVRVSELLISGSLDSWCKLNKNHSYKNNVLYKEKLRAKELIDVLEKNYKNFIASKKNFLNSAVTLSQIQRTKEMVEMNYDYTAVFLQAQFKPLESNQLEILDIHERKFPELEFAIKDLKSIYKDNEPEALEQIPQENLPPYLRKKD